MSEMTVRRARREDLPVIVGMLADDHLGAKRESPDDLTSYEAAFATIDADPHQYLAICEVEGQIAGTMQLTVIPGLSHKGMTRLLIEGVRVHRDARSGGIGEALIKALQRRGADEGWTRIHWLTHESNERARRLYDRFAPPTGFIQYRIPVDGDA